MIITWLILGILTTAQGNYQIVYNHEPVSLWGSGCGERLRWNLQHYLEGNKSIMVEARKAWVVTDHGPFLPFWVDNGREATTLRYNWDAYSPMLITINWAKSSVRISISRKFEDRNCGVSWSGHLKYLSDGAKTTAYR